MTIYHGINFPEEFGNPRFVQTVSGAFTIEIDWGKHPHEFTEEKRLELSSLALQVLQNVLAEPVEDYKPKPLKMNSEKKTHAN